MPINLNNLVNQSSSNAKTPLSAKYFHPDLTGLKTVGLLNDTDAIIGHYLSTRSATLNHMNAANNNRYLTNGFNEQAVANQFGNDVEDTKTYSTSLTDLFQNHDADSIRHCSFIQVPKAFMPKEMTPVASNAATGKTISAGLIVSHLTRSKINDPHQTASSKYHQFRIYDFSYNLVLTIAGKTPANRTTVYIYPNQINAVEAHPVTKTETHDQLIMLEDVDINPFEKKIRHGSDVHDGLDDIYDFLFESLNITQSRSTFMTNLRDMIVNTNIKTCLASQAVVNQDDLFDDLASSLSLFTQTKNQFASQKNLIKDAYSLIDLDEEDRENREYEILYSKMKTKTLKRPVHRKLYKYTPYNFTRLSSVNTRLSLVDQLASLSGNKNVYKFVPTTPTLTTTEKYSAEQRKIIETTQPYTVGVAGAGSGKSHTLLGRLDFLKQNNIDLSTVLVTTFTNTGAQNIIDRFSSKINSLTNANLFHKIYQTNFNHELTNNYTLSNLLQIIPENSKLFKGSSTRLNVRNELSRLLKRSIGTGFQKVDPREITESLVSLINENLDDTVKLLDTISETSLLLEPIIVNALMQNHRPLQVPMELKNIDFIITDESQDTSAFEYILLLQLAKVNNAQLMIIGDANQTLYEFRDANPNFLNALEKSNVFKNYTMSTNYRSKQSILLLANQILDVLKTNETAKLQLHANQYQTTDAATFKSQVALENIALEKHRSAEDTRADLSESLENRGDFSDWIINEHAHNHQIAILAYRNADANVIGETVQKILTSVSQKPVTLAHTRVPSPKPNTWLSRMLTTTEDDGFYQQLKAKHATMDSLIKSLQDRLQVLVAHSKYGYNDQWSAITVSNLKNNGLITNSLAAVNNGRMKPGKFMGILSLTLINLETRKNNVRQLIGGHTEETNYQDSDIVVSTIHSAKGLEFDSVICYFDETANRAASQENLRLYGVALTRAKKQELVINRPSLDKPNGSNMPTPSAYGYEDLDMFKTPMRTAYARVLQNL